MALRIRLRRMGRKKAPQYRIVVAESSMPRDGRFVAKVGHYNPRTEPMTLVVDRAAARLWMARGAKPTETVESLFKRAGVYEEESLVESAAATVSAAASSVARAAGTAASRVAGAAAAAGTAVAETASSVAETVKDVAEDVVERVTGGDEEEAQPAEDRSQG